MFSFWSVPFIVRIPGVIFHASSAGITAYGIAKKNPLPYYLISVVLHIANNFFAFEASLTFGVFADIICFNRCLLFGMALLSESFKRKNSCLKNPVSSS